MVSGSKLRELSKEFSVDIIELVKHLKSIAEVAQVSVQIFMKRSMYKVRKILFPSLKLP